MKGNMESYLGKQIRVKTKQGYITEGICCIAEKDEETGKIFLGVEREKTVDAIYEEEIETIETI